MESSKRKSVHDDLSTYDFLAKENDFIEITEWTNKEGWDIAINDKIISLTVGQLNAINYLIKYLDYHVKN